MFSSLRNIFERHRRKLFITGAVLGGAYVIGRIAQWKLNEWYETQQVEFLVQSKKQMHFDGNQKTCSTTFHSLLPGLQEILLELLDTETITETLKSKPSDKIQLWEQLKILSFSRTVMAVYSSSLLLVFLRVQLNLLGGYMYLDIDKNCEEGTSGENGRVYVSDAIQKKYLGIGRYFLEVGVKKLVDVIKEVVEGVLGSVSLKQKLSYHDIKRMLGQMQQCLKFSDSGSPKYKLSSLILPSEDLEELNGEKDHMFDQLLNETADVLESEDFQLVLNTCLDVGFMYVMEKMKPLFIVDQQVADAQSDVICSIEDGCCSIHLPLARIIPIMTGKIHDVFAEDKNDYLQDIVNLECAKSFAANIYEAFSNRPLEELHQPAV